MPDSFQSRSKISTAPIRRVPTDGSSPLLCASITMIESENLAPEASNRSSCPVSLSSSKRPRVAITRCLEAPPPSDSQLSGDIHYCSTFFGGRTRRPPLRKTPCNLPPKLFMSSHNLTDCGTMYHAKPTCGSRHFTRLCPLQDRANCRRSARGIDLRTTRAIMGTNRRAFSEQVRAYSHGRSGRVRSDSCPS